MPLYYAAYTWASDAKPYWWPLSREVPAWYARTLLPAIIIGYAVPTVLMFMPWKNPVWIQNFEAMWQPSPMFVPLLTVIFAKIYCWRYPQKKNPPTPNARDVPADLTYLTRIYVVTGMMGAILHFGVMFQLLTSTDRNHKLTTVFYPDFGAEKKSLSEGLRSVFMADFWGFYVASYIWCCSAVWDLKRVGRTTVDVGKASALIFLANIVVGPGAALSGVWYWREVAMARTSLSK
jgi:hypothetical protein